MYTKNHTLYLILTERRKTALFRFRIDSHWFRVAAILDTIMSIQPKNPTCARLMMTAHGPAHMVWRTILMI